MEKHSATSRTIANLLRAAGILALASSISTPARAQQDQQEQSQDQPQAQEQSQQQPPDSKPKPTYAPQDADKPPYSNDRPRETADKASNPNDRPRQNAPEDRYQQARPPQPSQPLPGSLTIPAGTVLLIRTNGFLSSDHNQVGDPFTAVLEQPIVVNGWVVARRGQTVVGKVKAAQKAGRVKGTSQLGLELTDLTVVDGTQAPILTELWRGSGGTSHGQDAATVAGTTGFGALIGAAADWGRGAAIGAGAGAAAGIAAVLLTRGRPTDVPPETPLSFRLVDPVTIDTTKSQQAFLPVRQQDFEGGREGRRPPRLAAGYPVPYGPCGYYGCYGYPAYYRYYGGYYGRRWYRY
jgi:hypothetical protein